MSAIQPPKVGYVIIEHDVNYECWQVIEFVHNRWVGYFLNKHSGVV
jgi:hypothetical protein